MSALQSPDSSCPHLDQAPLQVARTSTWGAILFAMCFPGVMACIYFVLLPRLDLGSGAKVVVAVAYTASKIIQFAFPLFWVICVERRRLSFARPGTGGWRLGLAFGLVVAMLIWVLYLGVFKNSALLASTPAMVHNKMSQFQIDTPGRYLLFTLFLAGFHSLMEEYYWRWFVFRELRQRIGVWPANVLSSLAFMAHHVVILAAFLPERFWSAVVPFSLGVAVGGGMWAWIYQRTQSLYAAWISHLLIDAAILAVGYDMVFVG
ncbi:MAG: CPBP family intramembrane metalloprotease [Planctomycetota bacterium]|nr:MAG: CPBP family intramembrane metalloprotease [Planctomycetota bacterium]